MARTKADREDLLREATALVDRVEWLVPGETEPVLAGIRRDGRCSVYFGSDPCYHFDVEGRLRRSFSQGCLYRSHGTTLARLTRRREPGQVELLRVDLTPAEVGNFLKEMQQRIEQFVIAVRSGTATVQAQVTQRVDLPADLIDRLEQAAADPRLAPELVQR